MCTFERLEPCSGLLGKDVLENFTGIFMNNLDEDVKHRVVLSVSSPPNGHSHSQPKVVSSVAVTNTLFSHLLQYSCL